MWIRHPLFGAAVWTVCHRLWHSQCLCVILFGDAKICSVCLHLKSAAAFKSLFKSGRNPDECYSISAIKKHSQARCYFSALAFLSICVFVTPNGDARMRCRTALQSMICRIIVVHCAMSDGLLLFFSFQLFLRSTMHLDLPKPLGCCSCLLVRYKYANCHCCQTIIILKMINLHFWKLKPKMVDCKIFFYYQKRNFVC